MSPEIKDSSMYDYKTDIWSLGIIFYELFENIRFNKEEEKNDTSFAKQLAGLADLAGSEIFAELSKIKIKSVGKCSAKLGS